MAGYPARVEDSLAAWLLDQGRSIDTAEALWDGVCARLAERVPLLRGSLTVGTLHPQWVAWSFNWWRGEGVHREDRTHEGLATRGYQVSPVAWVHQHQRELRPDVASDDFPFLKMLRGRGGTDYVVRPLPAALTGVHVVSWATDAPGGFTDEHLAVLRAVEPAIAATFEVRAFHDLALTVLRTYLGRHAGEDVLRGRIRRGDGEPITAVIWCSDLRGFTAMSERDPPAVVIARLNDAFEAWSVAVHAHGGDVLKLMGDGMLAVFPVGDDEAAACRAAVAAARQAEAALGACSEARVAAGEAPLAFGLGLHLGTVTYGNIGAHDRLDFTVIGPAVNRASRLEGLTKVLGRVVVLSEAVAAHVPDEVEPLGPQLLKGVAEAVPVFGLRGARPAGA